MRSLAQNAVKEYTNTGISSVTYSDPHSLVTQMFDGALGRIAQAKGAIARKETSNKAELISKAVLIIGSLEGCLDHKSGGDLAENLSRLYEYINLTLAQANIDNDVRKLDEVSSLILEIRSAWVQIPTQFRKASA